MPVYTYVGNVDPGDETEEITVFASGYPVRLRQGQYSNFTLEEVDDIDEAFVMQPGIVGDATPVVIDFDEFPGYLVNPEDGDTMIWNSELRAFSNHSLSGGLNFIAVLGPEYIENPPVGRVSMFFTEDGTVSVKTDDGSVVPIGSVAPAIDLSETKGFKFHGASAGATRPAEFGSVEWMGTVEPTNMIDGDTWIDTSP